MPTDARAAADLTPPRGWVCYDGDCASCTRLARRHARSLGAGGFELKTLQDPAVSDALHLSPGAPLTEMRVLTPDGRVLGGADAVLHLAGAIWWLRPLRGAAHLPGGMALARCTYRVIARHRHLRGLSAPRRGVATLVGWLPFVLIPAAAFFVGRTWPAWAFMWLLAAAVFAGCKWVTWWRARSLLSDIPLPRSLAYLFLWIGMDAPAFLDTHRRPARPAASEWLPALVNIALGIVLVWFATPRLHNAHIILVGLVGLTGVLLLLHYGAFALLSLLWRAFGVDAAPLMNQPTRTRSLFEFWSKRWNAAFRDLSHTFVFVPVTKRFGPTVGLLAGFLASGLVHDLVISVPAHGGYGLPTLYFLLQAVGILFERSQTGRALGLGRGARGYLFAVIVSSVLFPLVAHPPFLRAVALPFLRVLGAS